MGEKKEYKNLLGNEKSPYLLQHAHNPVEWYPWGEEAFEKAKKENKPVFLSIGYSTCHWCHVMAHESFEDDEVARLLNDAFVSIKVDREERPDIDSIYMSVCQALTGSGGWPLTIFMTPDKRPFFAATYIPKQSKFGRVGMLDLIPQIKNLWESRRRELLDSADSIVSSIEKMSSYSKKGELKKEILDAAFNQLLTRYDPENGGFGERPKFPTPHNLLLLLRYWKRTGEKKALEMVEKTLDGIRMGGVYDHLGYGVHRYSTDEKWLLPHFEKMLYDQALVSLACIEAFQATGNEKFKRTAEEIFTYVLRDMTSPDGGFYSAEDADSEGVEGKFYVWSEDEIKNILNEKDTEFALNIFNTNPLGNFAEEATGRKTNENILHLRKPIEEGQKEQYEKVRAVLFSEREKRIHPHKDDKILTDWNGLMIASMAKGGMVFDNDSFIKAAEKSADFITKNLTHQSRLLHRFRDGDSGIDGNLDDYAFFIWGLIELYEATFDLKYLERVKDLNNTLLKHFWDDEKGGFFFTADDTEELIIRKKEIYDGAIPSGNSIMILNLLRISRLTGDSSLEEKAADIIDVFSNEVLQAPSAYSFFLSSFDFAVGPSYEVIIVGDPKGNDTLEMIKALGEKFHPNKVVILKPTGDMPDTLEFLSDYKSKDGDATAFVCVDYKCELPTRDIKKMLDLLE